MTAIQVQEAEVLRECARPAENLKSRRRDLNHGVHAALRQRPEAGEHAQGAEIGGRHLQLGKGLDAIDLELLQQVQVEHERPQSKPLIWGQAPSDLAKAQLPQLGAAR